MAVIKKQNSKVRKDKNSKNIKKTLKTKTNPNTKKLTKHVIWMEKKGRVKKNNDLDLKEKFRKELEKKQFEPSMKMLIRITESIKQKGSRNKTTLSRDTKTNYTRLTKHVVWMEKKGLVESEIKNHSIAIALTSKGRFFVDTIL
ncbi:hypothetical protein [Candidatus Nitrosopumilus koreensis]|nr:hypothetical protein [Candidatus Nitrosopumilus koreensis]